MSAFRNLTGQRFGRLRVIRRIGTKRGNATWLCECDCGQEKVTVAKSLRCGETRSCGCLQREIAARLAATSHSNLKHGHARGTKQTPEYNSYRAAKKRCNDPKNDSYESYGGRGVEFRFTSFQEFLAEVGLKPNPKHLYSLDRYPNSAGHYESGNVRWATAKQQRHNRRPDSPLQELRAKKLLTMSRTRKEKVA